MKCDGAWKECKECNCHSALDVAVEALEKISKDQEFAIARKVWYVEEAKRTIAQIEKMGEGK